jgi:hypothetical protein
MHYLTTNQFYERDTFLIQKGEKNMIWMIDAWYC